MYEISFIIPTYNNKRLLLRCLDSIEKQIDSKDRIIIIDDGSTDGTYEYIKEKYKFHQNISIITQVNSGSGVARNKGISLSDSKYIWFVDSDDYVVPSSLKKVKSYLYKTDIDMLFFDCYLNNTDINSWSKLNVNPDDKVSLMLSMHVPWNKIIKRELFDDVEFPTGRIRYQDHGTIPIIISKSKSFAYIKEPLYVYDFSHPNNMGKKKNKNDDMYVAFQNLLNYYNQQMLTESELEVVFINTFVFSQIYNAASNNFFSIYFNIKKVKRYLRVNFPEWRKSKCLSLTFKSKYSDVVKQLPLKILIGKCLRWSVLLPTIAIFFYKNKKK